ncbi:terpene synthase family protein [Nocardia sp. NPDC049190]|uniref:terpene synthase family protein n=1 Tax=Nocardia sp. NPDC049190 TaxID=3155650 RepID=UPI0033D54E04
MSGHETLFGIPILTDSHPELETIDTEVLEWAVARGLVSGDTQLHRLHRAAFGRLAARTLPGAQHTDVVLLAKWAAWLFHLDDLQDHGPIGRDRDLLATTYAGLLAVVDRHMPATSASDTSPVTLALADLWSSTSFRMSPDWHSRFTAHMRDHRDGFFRQLRDRCTDRVPTLTEYPAYRRALNGAFMLDLFEPLHHTEVPETLQQSWTAFCDATNDVSAWCNDLLSLDRENASGDTANFVTVCQHALELTIDEARIDVQHRIGERHADQQTARQRFVIGIERTPNLADITRHRLQQIADTLDRVPGSHLAWARESGRYLS